MRTKVLVTGALGYLGSRLRPYLRERGIECIGFDTGFFQDGLLSSSDDHDVVLGDMRSFPSSLLENVGAVIHLASISNDPFGNLDPVKIYDPTRRYTFELARICKERNIKFIFPSSCSIYGAGQGDSLVDEQGPMTPLTPYSLNKCQVEEDLTSLSDKDFSPCALRLATVFGFSPRLRFDLVINMLTAMAFINKKIILNSDGQAWRPNVHIDDVCEAFYRCIGWNGTGRPLIINVGDTSQNFRIIDMARMIQSQVKGCEIVFLKQFGQEMKPEDVELVKDRKVSDGVDKRTYKVSFEKAKEVFPGFQCRWTVEKGIAQLLEEFARLNLQEDTFKSFKYYRLQKIEYLYKNGHINEELYWTAKV